MKSREARLLLGFPPDYRPTPSQVKAAYKRKVWDVHPDRFPANERSYAESQFKMISEAYTCLLPGCSVHEVMNQSYLNVSAKYSLNEACSGICRWGRKFWLSFIHAGYEDWSSKGSWSWKTTPFSRPALPLHYFGNSWPRRYIWRQGLQKADRSKPFPQSFSSLIKEIHILLMDSMDPCESLFRLYTSLYFVDSTRQSF